MIQYYEDKKLVKIFNYGYAAWDNNPKYFDGCKIEKYLQTLDVDVLMSTERVAEIFTLIDKLLLNKSLAKIDFSNIVKINLLRKVTKVL